MGFLSGVLVQLYNLIGMTIIVGVSYLCYRVTGNIPMSGGVIFLGWVVFECIKYLVRKFKRTEADTNLHLLSRIGGAFISGFMGLIFGGAVLSALYISEGFIVRIIPSGEIILKGSVFYSVFSRSTYVNSLPLVKSMRNLNNLMSGNLDEDDKEEVESVIARLKEIPSVKAVMEDEQLRDSIRCGDYYKVFSNPNFQRLMRDKQFLEEFTSLLGDDSLPEEK